MFRLTNHLSMKVMLPVAVTALSLGVVHLSASVSAEKVSSTVSRFVIDRT
ncbi:MAG: hypothetical protein HY701_00830 [Gemmatimonadetes bacterium]|nr:hypothetical protein [Gemmatimonadota bacterium]